MGGQDLMLMQAMLQKMDWLESRQKVLAQNIANADTPLYKPQDLSPIDFKSMLGSSTSQISLGSSAGLATTNSRHMTGGGKAALAGDSARPQDQREVYETSPSGNAVVLEEQLLKMNQTAVDHNFIANLYEKNMKMLKDSTRSQ